MTNKELSEYLESKFKDFDYKKCSSCDIGKLIPDPTDKWGHTFMFNCNCHDKNLRVCVG